MDRAQPARGAAMKRSVLAGTALLCLAAVGTAFYSQHVWDMQPCPWCVLQRLIFLAVAAACVVGLLLPRLGGALALGFAGTGLASALWQHFVAAGAESCDLTLADRIMSATGLDGAYPELFMATATCAEARVELFGLPYEAYSGALFLAMGAAMAWVVVSRRR
jgi:disulfide bond formation protein DsbB